MLCVGKTDIGPKRMNNQDTFRIEANDRYAFAVVCDGMGGANGGSVASSLAADIFSRSLHRAMRSVKGVPTAGDLRRIMLSSLEKANTEVHELAGTKAELEGMGTTLVAFLHTVKGKTAVINVGDSRLYALRGGELVQITKDHSFVQFLIDTGAITPSEARSHPNRNIILRAIGINDYAEPDIFFADAYDMLLLCTDGLTGVLGEDEMAAVLCGDAPLEVKCGELISLANRRGATDNITVVLYG